MAWRKPQNINEWMSIFGRHWKKLVFTCLLVMIVVMAGSFKVPRVYNAEAKFRRVNDPSMTNAGGSNNTLTSHLSPIRNTFNEDLRGRAAVSQLIDDLNLSKDLPRTRDGNLTAEGQLRKADLVLSIQQRLKVTFETRNDNMDDVTVTFVEPDRELAPRIVNRLVENYISRTKQQLSEMLLNAKVFFDREAQRYRARVEELEGKKLRFEMQHPGLLPDDPASARNKEIEINAQLTRINTEYDIAKEQRGALVIWIQSQPELIEKRQMGENPLLTELMTRKTEIEKELDLHITMMGRTEEHPLVKKTRLRIADLEKKITETEAQAVLHTEASPNQARLDAEREAERLAGTLTALGRQREELTSQLEQYAILNRNFFVIRNEYVKMVRELAEAVEQATFWDENLRRTSIALQHEFNQRGVRLSVVQRADIARPSRPTVLMILAASLFVGVAAGLLAVLAAELLDGSFRSVDQAVDELKLPVLGAVTEIVSPAVTFRRKLLNFAVYPAIGTVLVLMVVVSAWLIYLSLEDTQTFEQLINQPRSFLTNSLATRG